MFANTNMGGMSLGFPDVCKTPTPVGPVPLPYPNISTGATGNPATAAMTVLCLCMPVHNQMTMTLMSNGDEAGVLGGVVSNLIIGPQDYNLGSFRIFMQGPPVQRLTSLTGHNGIVDNGVGVSIAPSQPKLLTLG
jgi:hypothetical protein